MIADWDRVFENALSRKIETLPWIRMPNRHDGDSFIELLEGHADGLAHYGCWCLLVQVASKTQKRGILARKDGSPHTAESVSRIVRANPQIMGEAIKRLLTIGWLIEKKTNTTRPVSTIPAGCQSDGPSRVEKPSGEERRGEEKRVYAGASPAPQASEHADGNGKGKLTPRQAELAKRCYAFYPRHEKPKDAERAILKALKDPKLKKLGELNGRTPEDELWVRVQEFAEYVETHKGEFYRQGQCFVPYPASWFNAGSYLVDPGTKLLLEA